MALRETVPFLVVLVFYLWLRLNALNGHIATATQHLPWKAVFLSWPAILWFYIMAILWPMPAYSFADPILIHSFSVPAVLLPSLFVPCFASAIAGTVFWIHRAAAILPKNEGKNVDFALASGVLLLFLPLLPALNLNALNPGDLLHGRYTYLPLAGLMLIVASACRFAGRWKAGAIAVAAVIVIVYVPLTVAQQKEWKDDLTVFTTAHELAPHNAPVARNLADARVRDALFARRGRALR